MYVPKNVCSIKRTKYLMGAGVLLQADRLGLSSSSNRKLHNKEKIFFSNVTFYVVHGEPTAHDLVDVGGHLRVRSLFH